jgi:signal transduction histidine kinase
LLDIINDVLDIAKIESSQLLLYFEAVEIGTVFNELALYFNDHPYRLAKQQVQFKLVAPKTKSDSILFTDKTKLKQILTNLISNALKFTYEGEIEVGVLPDKNGYLNFYVSDTGIGIPLDKQTLIFERFVQVRNNSFEDFKGTGLGLAIVKGLVELLGGKIELKSQPNIGSTFSFKLPISIDVDVKDCAV